MSQLLDQHIYFRASVIGIGHLTGFGQWNLNRHYANRSLKYACLIGVASCTSATCHEKDMPYVEEWKMCDLKLDQQPEASSKTARSQPRDPWTRNCFKTLTFWGNLLYNITTGHSNLTWNFKTQNSVKWFLLSSSWMILSIVICSIEEGFSYVSSPWYDKPGLSQWKFPSYPKYN